MIPFLSKSSTTLLAITATEVLRAEFSGGNQPQLKQFLRADRPAGTTITAAAELAVSLSDAKPCKHTILVAEDFWTGIIDIDDRSIYGLEGDDLNQMLKFETETLSNLDPMNCHLGIVELAPVPPDTRRFWCTGVPADVLNSLATMIALRGGKLVTTASTLGLAGPTPDTSWVEFHTGIAAAFATSHQGLPRASITPRSTQSDRWYRSLDTNFGSDLPMSGWLGGDAISPIEFTGNLVNQTGDEVLQNWSVAAAANLQGSGLPLVLPAAPETSPQTFARVGSFAAVAAAAFCIVNYANYRQQSSAISEQIQAIEQPAEEQQRLKKQLADVTKQVKELKTELAAAETKQTAVESLTENRGRYAALLRLIAIEHVDTLVVDEIAIKPVGLQVIGRSIRSDSPSQLAMELAKDAAPLGWEVRAPELMGKNQMVNGGPWRFTIDLIDTIPTQLDSLTDTVAKTGPAMAAGAVPSTLTNSR